MHNPRDIPRKPPDRFPEATVGINAAPARREPAAEAFVPLPPLIVIPLRARARIAMAKYRSVMVPIAYLTFTRYLMLIIGLVMLAHHY